MSKFKLAIIGATGTALKRTIPVLTDSEICKVVAIQARDIKKLETAAKEFNIPSYYTDSSEMINSADYDAIFIATPPFMHLDDIKLCLSKQKPIICEKPLARNYEEGLEISKLLKEHISTPFMVAHHFRHQKKVLL